MSGYKCRGKGRGGMLVSIGRVADSSICVNASLHNVLYENDCDVFNSFLLVAANFVVRRPLCCTGSMIMPSRSYPYRLLFILFSFGYTQHIAELW